MTTVVRSRTRTPCNGPGILFGLNVGELDERCPVRDLALDELAELGGSPGGDVHADGRELLLHFALLQRLYRSAMDLLNDIGRRLRGRDQREPGDELVARQRLGDRRLIGGQRRPLRRGYAEAPELSALRLRESI